MQGVVQTGGIATIKGCGTKIGTWIWSANRETETEAEIGIGIGIILAAVVVVAAEDITTTTRDTVRNVVMGMGGRLMNGGDDVTLTFDRTVFIVQCTYFDQQYQPLYSFHYPIVYIDFHPVTLAAKTSTFTTSGAPVSSSSTDENKAAATLPARWASLPASLAKKSMMPKVLVPGR